MQPQQKQLSSLQLKLQLLRTLLQGNIQEVQSLLSKIKAVTKINPQLYQKFSVFVTDNKQGLVEMEKQQKQQNQQPKIVIENVDGELDDDEYDSDASWSTQSDQEEEQQAASQKMNKSKTQTVLKESINKQVPKVQKNSINLKKQKPVPTNPQLAFKKNPLKQPVPSNASNNKPINTKN